MSKFFSNVMKLSSATLIGQILGIIVTPFLSRLYTPSDFGIYQLFLSIVSVIIVISTLSYANAIQLPKEDEDAANIVILCVILIGITTIFTTILLIIFWGYIKPLINETGFSIYLLLLIPFAIIISSIPLVLNPWIARKAEFGTIAKASIYSSVSGKAISLSFGYISPSPFGLIFGTITNDATILVVLLIKTVKDIDIFRRVSYERIKQLAYRYIKFPQYNTIADLASVASLAVVPLMLAIFFSSSIIGYYAMALMVISLPTKFLGGAIAAVFYQKACDEKNINSNIKEIVIKIYTRLISIGIFASFILLILGPELFTFALGSQWTTAGVYAQIIAPWQFVAFITVPLSSIFNVLEKQSANLWFSIIILISRTTIVFIAGLYGDPVIFMVLLSITGVLCWGGLNMYALKIASVPFFYAIREIIRYFLMSLVFCIPLIIAKYYSISNTILFGIAIIISVLYYSVIILRDTPLKKGLMNSLTNILQK